MQKNNNITDDIISCRQRQVTTCDVFNLKVNQEQNKFFILHGLRPRYKTLQHINRKKNSLGFGAARM